MMFKNEKKKHKTRYRQEGKNDRERKHGKERVRGGRNEEGKKTTTTERRRIP